tara:strand:+ start:16143 stop:18431 length:2289 start_codon:yes stop_codon:yes gene_type:complete
MGEEEELEKFLTSVQGGGYNVYFSVNPPMQAMNKKASRGDIDRMTFLHVDLDPEDGGDPEAERARLLAMLTTDLPKGVPEPTCIVDSGGGYWGFWRLDDPFLIEGDAILYEEAKLFNLQLETAFGADNCHNVDRIARLPGTVNWAGAKKKAKGRVDRMAQVVQLKKLSYPLKKFTKATQVSSKGGGFSSGRTIEIDENVQRVMDLDKELPPSVPTWCKCVISQGRDLDDPTRFAKPGTTEIDRSDALFYVVCELVRNNVSDDMIYAIITDKDWAISESVREDESRMDRYAKRQIERAHEYAVDPLLAKINNQYAVVQNAGAGKCKIIYQDQDNGVMVYQSPTDFKAFYSNQFIEVDNGDPQKPNIRIPVGKWWFEHPMRRSFNSIAFLPGEEVGNGVYNLWRGFAYEAREGGSCDLYLDHVRNVICSGDEEIYKYLINWMSLAVQRPAQPGHTAIVLRGSQGAGKGTFAKTFAQLFGHHGKQITDEKHLTGNFNAHLRDCIVLFADEAVAAGGKNEGILKALVTEEHLLVEAKGVDAMIERNYLHVIMASNEEWVVPVGVDDRRFVMLDVSDEHVMDAGYWSALNAQLRDGGHEALLHHLLTLDISEFDPRERPKTEALQDQKALSMNPLTSWWHGVLQEGAIGEVSLVEATTFPTGSLAYEYNSGGGNGGRKSVTKIRVFLERALQKDRINRQLTMKEFEDGALPVPSRHQYDGRESETQRPMVFDLPPLKRMRQSFDEVHGGPYDWRDAAEIEPEAGEVF